ncbi:unnamed protein product [Brachionus calyciflorus]|uniref:PPM-type phosphatase domain-containing protein n=1 Tax=Brachionus calyciflorus TaxID=104777 RepID=A0A813Y4U9_9BILA|nr:unnamed protein product [Brachionus calyciflorus]
MSDNLSLNMRVTANSSQGHRKYMEDCYKIRFQRDTQNPESDILFSYFGIFDGHGGKEASQYCKEKLYWKIIEQDEFWSDNDSLILNAIRNGFVQCHLEMWNELPNWNKTPSGLPSTSGTTATILFIKKNKAYCGHVGDSGLVIGYTRDNDSWQGKKLTRDHKPEDPIELKRIQNSGGSVMSKSGVNRVVWNRPVFTPGLKKSQSEILTNLSPYEINYQRGIKNCPTEKIPFLAVARSLGDLWSYNVNSDEFIVSPVPDVFSFDLDPRIHKCLILATDGLWNVLKSTESVELVRQTDRDTEKLLSRSMSNTSSRAQPFINPSQRLVNTAMQKCCEKMIRADNTSCITIMIDPPPSNHIDDHEDQINLENFENILKQNKTLEATKFNISDEFDYAEVNDDDCDNFEHDEELTKTFSGQMLTSSTLSEFTTPLTSDKRSRSLVSLRRRHWSANHRSTTTTNNNNNYINTQDRERRNHITNNNNNLNITSISMVNKISKNLRKSFNDLYNNNNTNTNTTTSNNKNTEEGFKENNNDNKYSKRFKMFKNRLIKTKNSLFNRKNLKSISSPNLKCLQQQQEDNKKRDNNYLNETSSNQSFVNNMKLRFVNNSRRNQSKYLNSTAITTKMMSQTDLNRCDANHLDEDHQQQHTPSKRAKFY